jgi:hypothetical protein
VFRILLIIILVYLVARSAARLFRAPRSESVRGRRKSDRHTHVDESRIQDAKFKDIPDK